MQRIYLPTLQWKEGQISQRAAFDIFLTNYKKTDEQHLNEVKKMDAPSLPPFQRVLREKIARTSADFGDHQYFQVYQQHLHQRQQDGTLKITNTR